MANNDNAQRGVPYWPRGMSRLRAAFYVGITPQAFERMVAAGDMPKPTRLEGRQLWDRFAVDKALDLAFGTNSQGEEIVEFEAGPPISEWPIETRPLPLLQERALAHMYQFRNGQFFCADGCGPKTYAALEALGLIEAVGEVRPGKMPAYRLTKLGIKKMEAK
jgi:hypothetical protein